MAKEAGFNVTLRPQEFASALNDNDAGKHQAFLIGWSGRVDPDGNIHQAQTCKGTLNATLACDERVDALLEQGARGDRPEPAPGRSTGRRST